jgi:hypothetical protein
MSMMYPPMFTKDKPPSVEWIRSQYALLSTTFAERNGEYSVLRRVFDGDYASMSESKTKTGTPFQDRIKLLYNVSNASVRRYMDQMSSPPRIEAVPEGFEMADIEACDKKTKFLEYIYHCNNMGVKLMQMAFYQSLLDNAVINIRPAPHLPHKIRIELGVPDFYYPITRGDDWSNPVGVIYAFRTFKGSSWVRDPMRFNSSNQEFDVNIEYWDHNWYTRIEPERTFSIHHGLGEIPWFQIQNLPIPHRFRGQGDVDQVVGMNEYLNMLMSAMGDMIAYAAAPIAVVRGTKVGGVNLPYEPRAVWELERDAQVGFLQWSGTPPAVEAQILRTLQAIEDLTGVSSPAFGREIPSGISGNAVRSLLAGFNTRLGTKQQMLGEALVRANECILKMAEMMFPNEEFRVIGENSSAGKDLGRRKFYSVKPKEFGGWYKNRVLFSPLDPAATYFQEVDKFSKGLQSKFTTMKNLGVSNVWDELERMRFEKQEEASHENNMGLAKQGKFQPPVPPEEQKAEMDQLIEQIVAANRPKAIEDKRAKEQTARDTQQQTSTGVINPQSSTPQIDQKGPQEAFNVDDALQRLRQAQNLSGRASLNGNTVMLENPQDEPAVRQALGAYGSMVKFMKTDPDRPLPEGTVTFYQPKTEKKNPVELRSTDGYLSVVVLQIERTNNQAVVYTVGLRDEKGNIVPAGKTDPSRASQIEQGELIRVSVGNVSRRSDNDSVRWGLSQMKPVQSQSIPAKPSSFKDVEKLFESGNKR